jgi:hypothetical protein
MEAVRTSETSVSIYLTTRQYIPEDFKLQKENVFEDLFIPLGSQIFGTGSGTPGVPELPSAWRYNWTTRHQGNINLGTSPPGWGLGVRPATLPWKTLATKCQTRNNLSYKAKTHRVERLLEEAEPVHHENSEIFNMKNK